MTPSIAPARARRVQGIDSDIGELRLRGGKRLTVKIGGAILPAPVLKRGMGNSSIELTVHDPKLRWLKLGLAAETWEAEIDGLWFRYLGTSKQGKQLTLRFEDRDVARLRELKGPEKVYARRGEKNETTRAEFIVSLVKELKGPKLKIVCPELHEKQPIASREKGEEAQESARTDRGKGVGDTKGLTVKGEKATPEQRDVGDRALRVAEHRSAPFRVKVALMEALIVESGLGAFSSNYLQLEPTTAADSGIKPNDLEASVDGFLAGYINGEGGALAYYKHNSSAPAHKIAQEVQRSGAGLASGGASNYGPWEDEAREWVETVDGGGGPESEEVSEPITFEIGKKENYWQAIQRLAKQVNWRAFVTNGTFYYISEPELIRSQVRLAIELDEEGDYSPAGIEEVDFDYNLNKPITSATVTAFVKQWGAPPGSVVTLKGFGPASIGFGSPPVKADDKGRKQGISSNRKAKTGEGKGRYLVSSIEVPIAGDAEARLGTFEIRKPTAPLPEPRPESQTVNTGAGGSLEPGGTGGMVEWAKSVLGTREGSGRHVKWAKDLGLGTDLPWCSIFIAYGLKNIAGISDLPQNPAYSGAWLDWPGGARVGKSNIEPGDLIIYDWGDGGITDHVALYIDNGKRIGGNESDAVSESDADLGRAVGIVRPNYG